jgi:glucose/arabinose dehydrogenase/PKD repeat protein
MFIRICIVLSITISFVQALPIGFVDEGVTSFTSPMTATFVPNPRKNGKPMMIVVSKEGIFNVLEDPDISDVKISAGNMQSIMCTNGSRGIFGIAPHPDFLSNPYLYVYYTRIAVDCPADAISGTRNRLSRFRMDPITLQITLASELVLLENAPATYLHHDGGAMFIGNDRNIYLALGDGGNILRAQDLQYLNGKIIRLGLTGNVPAKNPFTIASGGKGVNCRQNGGRPPINAPFDSVCEEIFAYGLRNPFRVGADVNTKDRVRFALADVGKDNWDEINYGGTDYKGRNYGWPIYEGPCKIDSYEICPRQTGFQEPFYFYQYRPVGGAATGSVFVPDGVWPIRYKYMFAEHVEGLIVNLVDDRIGCRNCVPPRPGRRNETFHTYERIVDIFFAPYQNTQAMYYVSRKAGGQNIRRIRYVGGANRPPTAVITLSKTVFSVNETITLSGANSSDPNGDALTYLWNFGGGLTSTLMNPVVSFPQMGTISITLTVRDGGGLTSSAFQTISIGTPPSAIMESPVDGSQFVVGEILRLRGRARDMNSMQLLDPTRIFWDVQIRHAGHFHPFMSNRSGNNFDLFPAPSPEGFTASTNSHLQITMTVVDSNGLSQTIRRNVLPKKVLLDIRTNVAGLKVLIDDFEVTAPITITAWEKQNLKLEVVDQSPYVFQSWSIGGSRVTSFLVPPKSTPNPIIVANFRKT